MPLDTAKIRQEFPILRESDLIYLDSAATAQKPEMVLEAMDSYYKTSNANVHRGMHALAERATVAYEDARKAVASFIGAKKQEIIFTKNCTEAINLVSRCFGVNVRKGDTIVLPISEHHSNIVPWMQLKGWIGVNIEWIGMNEDGSLKLEDLEKYLQTGTVKLVSVSGLSNVLGTTPDLNAIIMKSHDAGAKVLIDAAQLIVHEKVDVKELDCDFLTFSAHKLYGPTGIGVLYAKQELLEQMPPYLGGGSMITEVTTKGFSPTEIPHKFEAGTPPIAEAIGLHAAINWVQNLNWNDMQQHKNELIVYAKEQLTAIDGLHILGNPKHACISFTIDGVHPHDLTEILGRKNICLRAGHHCTQPLHDHLGIPASTRMSFAVYNTKEDIDACVQELLHTVPILKKH